jgi:hypothetical protein
MIRVIDLILADENVSWEFKRHIASIARMIDAQDRKAGSPADLRPDDIHTRGSKRWQEVGDECAADERGE